VTLGSGNINVNLNDIESGIREGVREATEIIPLRPNVVNPITREGGETNTGDGIPHINYKIADFNVNGLELLVFPKGGGSENVGAFAMLTPKPEEETVEEIKKFVLDAVLNAAGKPCPPTIIGVGIGGSADMAMSLAKTALLRPIGVRNEDGQVARIENELLEAVNSTGIGPMGLGGKTTALDVHIETADTHITSLPVAINFQCWVARKASAKIYSSGEVEYL
jgi:fumarate hydratase subunit alpha